MLLGPDHHQGHREVRALPGEASKDAFRAPALRRCGGGGAGSSVARAQALVERARRRDRRRHGPRTLEAGVLETIERAETRTFPDLPLVGGNVATRRGRGGARSRPASRPSRSASGPGSICTTRIVAGVGVPQFTAVLESARDGRRRFGRPGDLRRRDQVLRRRRQGTCGRRLDRDDRRALRRAPTRRRARSCSSRAAPTRSIAAWGPSGRWPRAARDRYFQSGVEDRREARARGDRGHAIPYRGSLTSNVHQLLGGLRSGMGYCGAHGTWPELRAARALRAGLVGWPGQESHVHDVIITKEAPELPDRVDSTVPHPPDSGSDPVVLPTVCAARYCQNGRRRMTAPLEPRFRSFAPRATATRS